ncbi:MAG: hypothetical protein R3183_02260 [Oleiphilaceae bacterium]|nr:hypothetical protein [Oleiphilaceae bacterium]
MLRAATLTLLLLSTVAGANSLQFTGHAFDPESGELLYTEHHYMERDTSGALTQGRVIYRGGGSDSSAVWADKRLVFGANPLLPELSFYDQRFGTDLNLTRQANRIVIEQNSGEGLQQQGLSLPEEKRVVADAGFDRLVEREWHALLNGTSIEFEFVAITRGKLVSFQIRKQSQSDQRVVFIVEPQNWFFRMLVDPIVLHYDLAQRRLRRFEGLTNIAKARDGDNFKARIEYSYADEVSNHHAQSAPKQNDGRAL